MIAQALGLQAAPEHIQTIDNKPDQPTSETQKLISSASTSIQDSTNKPMKLNMYLSFVSRRDAVGLELFEAFDKYCKKFNRSDFSLFLRLSDERLNPQRWTNEFVS